MSAYLPRLIDSQLAELLDILPAIALNGPKGVGKTASARRQARTVVDLDDPFVRETVAAEPQRFLGAKPPVLLDEWQRMPEVWDRVRRQVDDGAEPGRFLLTGSAYPQGAAIHSGAGRIVPVRMRPLALAERGIATATVSLDRLLEGDATLTGDSAVLLSDYVEEITASGFPGIRPQPARARGLLLDAYIDNVIQREFPDQGLTVRAPDTLRRWLRAYAAAVGTTASYSRILDSATPGEADKPAKTTTIAYRDVLSNLWLLDPVPAWAPDGDAFGRLAQTPKHYLADPALSARLLDLDLEELLGGGADRNDVVRGMSMAYGSILGRLFEALVALSLHAYCARDDARLAHLRTRNGDREVDFVVQRKNAVVAVEVKLSASVSDDDVRHLRWLKARLGDRLADAIVVTTGPTAYRRADGIGIVPAALLGA
ncbi:MAG: DUF4143 domain-containing protein [Microbacterium sp.]|uniref:ATP-binding protein n=1 Tax=Microbacterium sp. TaxID=51671 RepID=UPI0039E233EB